MRPESKKKSSWLSFFVTLACIIAAVLIVNNFVLINARIPSGSMEPQIEEGDRIFGNRLAYLSTEPERFDVVIFRYPDDPSILYIKRIIGLPGESVTINNGKVYINDPQCEGEPLDDSFCKEEPQAIGDGTYEVPEGCYFMLGDNRNNSHDSRFWDNKYVPEEEIVGKAVLKYWPLTELSIID